MIISRYCDKDWASVEGRLVEHAKESNGYPELDVDLAWIRQSLYDNPLALLATDGENLLGLIIFGIYEHWHTPQLGASDLIISVDPAYRSGRVAKALIKGAEEWARQLGCVYFQMSTAFHTDIDSRTLQYYRHLGYKDRGSVVYKLLGECDGVNNTSS